MNSKIFQLNNKFQSFIIILFYFFVRIQLKPLPERILISNKIIVKNNSIVNSKTKANISNLIFKRKLDNFTNFNNGWLTNTNTTGNKTNKNGTKKNDDKTKIEEEPATYLLSFFVLFVFIGLYMICKMKDYEQTKNRTDDVWKFLFFANNGALLESIINIIFFNNTVINYSPLILSGIVFGIGSIYYLYQYIKKCNHEYASHYFSCEKAGEWFELPCFIISLIGLTDPCCRRDHYTETTYEDGHKESNYCCVCIWNILIYIIKRIALYMTIISYYLFIIFFMIFWFLAFLIYSAISNKKQNSDQNSNSNAQNSGNNITQTNSTNNDGVNSTIKNQLNNTEANSEFNNYNLNNNYQKNKGVGEENKSNIESNSKCNNMQDFKSESSIKSFKEYFNQPQENINNKFGMKSINVIHSNANGNIAQNQNNPGNTSIPKSFAEFY